MANVSLGDIIPYKFVEIFTTIVNRFNECLIKFPDGKSNQFQSFIDSDFRLSLELLKYKRSNGELNIFGSPFKYQIFHQILLAKRVSKFILAQFNSSFN